ncbi:hypothetical protein EXE53_15335 [Halorubrum sp. SD626R]|uniref:hypothetical protein n=1 Tax=Halorubrum sp. SD626R TaxID=1419722 RepID=UPI0010F8C21E|nr:hypothetical protein [Halorubrum sp. SD626R]TKX79536.1 hypothetical protein EXE53_15335 [Halorubrum sp. SD626R]
MAQANQGGQSRTRLNVQVSDRRKMELNRIAYQLSEPGDNVTPSEIVREAIEDYVQKFAENPDHCDPRGRGSFGGEQFVEVEVDDGAA